SFIALNQVQAYTVNGNGSNFSTLIGDYQTMNMFAVRPQLPDGTYLYDKALNLQIGGSAKLKCSTSPCLLGSVTETGSTYSMSSTNSSGYDLMTVSAAGGSQPGGKNGPGQGGGGGGTGTMTAS